MSTSPNESNVDVLVVGAGPAGLMFSHALAKAGINVRVVEKRAEQIAAGQADGVNARSMEILQSYGLAERLLREANQIHQIVFYNPGAQGGIERVATVPQNSMTTARYSFGVTLHQGAIEAIFLDAMKDLGLTVERQTVPVSMHMSKDEAELNDASAYPVKVVLQKLNASPNEVATETVHAKFVIGADGAHSWVRKSLGIEMEGNQTEYKWGVVDMVSDTDIPDMRSVCIIHSDNGSCIIIPREGDALRLYVQLSDADVMGPSTGRGDPTKIGPTEILEVARKSLHPYKIATPKEFGWSTVYIIGQRVAAQYSTNNRVFIVGDACHTHSPQAGQGMNASMADSHNLAWKLAQVLRGSADISLLKTYEIERRKFALDLISFDREYAALASSKVSHEEFFQAFEKHVTFTSGLTIQYADSAIVNSAHQSAAKHIIIGQRISPQVLLRVADARPYELHDLIIADTRFKLLVFTGDTSPGQSSQGARVERLAEELHGVLAQLGTDGGWERIVDVITISSRRLANMDYTDVPELLRSHWSKVFVDDVDLAGQHRGSGKAYENFGIQAEGVVVVVRPDGHVGAIFPFDAMQDARVYFAGFMRTKNVQLGDGCSKY